MVTGRPAGAGAVRGGEGGYSTLYELWNQWDVVWDRPVFYYATAREIRCGLFRCRTSTIPVVVFRGWLVHGLQRVHYGWVTVPEGYGIPRVQGSVQSLMVQP